MIKAYSNNYLNILKSQIRNIDVSSIPIIIGNSNYHSSDFQRHFTQSVNQTTEELLKTTVKSNLTTEKLSSKVLEELKKKADTSDAQAKFDYALKLSHGEGIKEDKELAKKYFKEAADLGHWESAMQYSIILLSKITSMDKTKEDHNKPEVVSLRRTLLKYLKIACACNEPLILVQYATYCNEFPDLHSEANEYFKRAADKGYAPASLAYINGVLFHNDDPNHSKTSLLPYIKQAADNNLISEIQHGILLIKAGLRKEGYDILQKLSDGGDLEASAELGNHLLQQSTSENSIEIKNKAMELLQKSADKGGLSACYQYGAALLNDKKFIQAIPYLRKASESPDFSNQKSAQTTLGAALLEIRNYEEGIKFLQKSADSGDGLAWYNLGLVYQNGKGVKRDLKKASECYMKGAEYGDTGAKLNYAVMLQTGQGIKQDVVKAQKLFQELVSETNEKDYDVIYNYAFSLMESHLKPGDREKAIQLLDKAAKNGHVLSMGQIGLIYLQNPNKIEEGRKMLEMAAEKGNVQAAFNLFVAYFRGYSTIKKDQEKALKYCKMAADYGHPRAKMALLTFSSKTNKK